MKFSSLGSAVAALALLRGAAGDFVKFSPEDKDSGITFRVNVPESTASSKSGPINIQIEAPSDLSWIALGQGTQMKGSNIFVVYSSSASNITLSPRLGTGHSEPKVNPETKYTLLNGTGISNGKMTASFRCENCLSWKGGSMKPQSSSSSWIWASKKGDPINSSDISHNISRHDAKGGFTLDLTKAKGGSAGDPFSESKAPSKNDSSSESFATVLGFTKRTAHGLIMSTAFVVLFPLIAVSLYLVPYSKKVSRIHAPLQVVTLCLVVAGLGLGISFAEDIDTISSYHSIIGIVVVGCLILFQPALGLVHHLRFRKTGEGSHYGVLHRWFGRLVLCLGVINGGLGFRFSGIGTPGVPQAGAIAYGVVAGAIGIFYIAVVSINIFRSKGSKLHGQDAAGSEDSEQKVAADQSS